ncbi:MAG: glucose-1-phosphate adenylyltransferase [Gammaproteobacteria bacterium]|nr:glucose-1-phosphate adenylyltransferase [Gammaproteobacteria bacterium]
MNASTLSVILAGGYGSRLLPLTRERTKPAVPFGGKYRIIDFPLANCLHSGLRRILVLTQYKSLSLHKHLRDGWSLFNPELGEFITPVPPQMQSGDQAYEGTADAVYQNLNILKRSGARWMLILSGDQIYRMDYAPLLKYHRKQKAGMTVACMSVPKERCKEYSILSCKGDGRVTGIHYQPSSPHPDPEASNKALASMGMYVFSVKKLAAVLEADAQSTDSSHDFDRDIIPRMVESDSVQAYRFGIEKGRVTPDRYWCNLDSLDSYYRANMELLDPVPSLDLYQRDWPIHTYQPQSPPARTVPGASGSEGIFINSIVASGVVINGGSVQHSILFPQVHVGDEAVIHDALLFNGVQVGAGAELQHCIIDKDVVIPPGERIGFNIVEDAARFTISDEGVVVVPRGYRF